jgi:hypothetical protein
MVALNNGSGLLNAHQPLALASHCAFVAICTTRARGFQGSAEAFTLLLLLSAATQ